MLREQALLPLSVEPAVAKGASIGTIALPKLRRGITNRQLATLTQRGYRVVGERSNALMGQRVLLLRTPATALLGDPVAEVRALGRNVRADRNHYYRSNHRGNCRFALFSPHLACVLRHLEGL